jgi:hypothetical protein
MRSSSRFEHNYAFNFLRSKQETFARLRAGEGRAELRHEEEGLRLARGDRRDFVVVDYKGGVHALSKRITGVPARQTRDRLADLDRVKRPSVEEACAQQQFGRALFGLGDS